MNLRNPRRWRGTLRGVRGESAEGLRRRKGATAPPSHGLVGLPLLAALFRRCLLGCLLCHCVYPPLLLGLPEHLRSTASRLPPGTHGALVSSLLASVDDAGAVGADVVDISFGGNEKGVLFSTPSRTGVLPLLAALFLRALRSLLRHSSSLEVVPQSAPAERPSVPTGGLSEAPSYKM